LSFGKLSYVYSTLFVLFSPLFWLDFKPLVKLSFYFRFFSCDCRPMFPFLRLLMSVIPHRTSIAIFPKTLVSFVSLKNALSQSSFLFALFSLLIMLAAPAIRLLILGHFIFLFLLTPSSTKSHYYL
jgi:hypothetical protein